MADSVMSWEKIVIAKVEGSGLNDMLAGRAVPSASLSL